ncbi:hypothetical protein ACIQUQ_20600 [Streptomyces sp. NPDC101118]|uniref:hypothetical protein n=1 Tax=Streptomyces sp. NPDC101118 TaxID=3366109 RepID=UPI00381E48F8
MGGMQDKKQQPGKGREEQKQKRDQQPGQGAARSSRQEGKSPEELRRREDETGRERGDEDMRDDDV